MTEEELLETVVKLYQYRLKSKRWDIIGYKCPYCYKHYATLRKEFYSHVENCEGIVRDLGEL